MFNRSSFSPTSFSHIAFAGATAPLQQDGRSGYWRLFYYNLQEESLKKGAEKAVESAPPREEVPTKLVKKAPPKVKPAGVEEFHCTKLPPFIPLVKPIGLSVYEQLRASGYNWDQFNTAANELEATLAETLKQRKRRQCRRAAAFLLMAA